MSVKSVGVSEVRSEIKKDRGLDQALNHFLKSSAEITPKSLEGRGSVRPSDIFGFQTISLGGSLQQPEKQARFCYDCFLSERSTLTKKHVRCPLWPELRAIQENNNLSIREKVKKSHEKVQEFISGDSTLEFDLTNLSRLLTQFPKKASSNLESPPYFEASKQVMQEQILDLQMPSIYLDCLYAGVKEGSAAILDTLWNEVASARWERAAKELGIEVESLPKDALASEKMASAKEQTLQIEAEHVRSYLEFLLEKLPNSRKLNADIQENIRDYLLDIEGEKAENSFSSYLSKSGFFKVSKSKASLDWCFELYKQFIEDLEKKIPKSNTILQGELAYLKTHWDPYQLDQVALFAETSTSEIDEQKKYYEAGFGAGIAASTRKALDLSGEDADAHSKIYQDLASRFDELEDLEIQKKIIAHLYADPVLQRENPELVAYLLESDGVREKWIQYDLWEGILEAGLPVDEKKLLTSMLIALTGLSEEDLSGVMDPDPNELMGLKNAQSWISQKGMQEPLCQLMYEKKIVDAFGQIIEDISVSDTASGVWSFLAEQKALLNAATSKLPVETEKIFFEGVKDHSVRHLLDTINEDLKTKRYNPEDIRAFIERASESGVGFSYYLKNLGVVPTPGKPIEKAYDLYRFWTKTVMVQVLSLLGRISIEGVSRETFAYQNILDLNKTQKDLEEALHFNEWAKLDELTDQIIYTLYQSCLARRQGILEVSAEQGLELIQIFESQRKPGNRTPAQMIDAAVSNLPKFCLKELESAKMFNILCQKENWIREQEERNKQELEWIQSSPFVGLPQWKEMPSEMSAYEVHEFFDSLFLSLSKVLVKQSQTLGMSSFDKAFIKQINHITDLNLWTRACRKVAYAKCLQVLDSITDLDKTANLNVVKSSENFSLEEKINLMISILEKNSEIPQREEMLDALNWKNIMDEMVSEESI